MYLEFYGFSEQPFETTPDPRFLFLTESHREALNSMAYGIQGRKGFISVSGEVGTGKTTIIHHLLDHLDSGVKVVLISQTKVTFEQLLRDVLWGLELPTAGENKSSLIRQFNKYLMDRLARNQNLALLIDEAQHLSIDALEDLRLLSNLETSTSKLLQIVLVGQPELEEKLNSRELRQLKQRIVISRRILPLREADSSRYIEHRLKMVGSTTSQVLTPDAVSIICHHSKGIPRTINILCDNAFLIGYDRGSRKVNALIIQEAIRYLEAASTRELPAPKTGSKKRIRPVPPRFKGRVPIISFAATALVFLAFALFLVRGPMKGLPENLGLWPSWQQLAIGHQAAFPPAEIKTEIKEDMPPEASPTPPAQQEPEAFPPPAPAAPVVQPQHKPEIRVETVSIKEGATICDLAQKYYRFSNTTLADYILQFNPDITNPNLIRADSKIKIPEIKEESLIIRGLDNTCKVHLGTFLRPESAQRYKEEPALQGKEIDVVPRKFPNGEVWYRVLAGKFPSWEKSLETIQALKEKGVLPLLKSR